jgi:2-dehydro-3-deoxyphosphogluconate aldolase/(4S)-4-hydroxy-2-oxoglutarate aldolase
MKSLEETFAAAVFVPVLTIEREEDAEPIAEALLAGGLRVLEVTLRTPASLAALERMARIEGAIVGAGTVLGADDVVRARDAGARFLVSPGFSEGLARAAEDANIPLLPGVATATEIMRAHEAGFSFLKFFPAEAAGGARAVQAFAAPFPQIRLCPTGGIFSADRARDYLALGNVIAVGGSWMARRETIAEKDWPDIARMAADAVAAARAHKA